MTEKKKTGLELLREPFPANQISKLPKPTRFQTDELKRDFKTGVRCEVCNGWHHPKVVHLDYVGHAALTDRLLDCDGKWNWEPVALAEDGTPKFDNDGGMWIRLTVCDVTRLGYGFADGKTGGNALKETIGDALRNAAMRFGAALDLWHKGELHAHDDEGEDKAAKDNPAPAGASTHPHGKYPHLTDVTHDIETAKGKATADELAEYFKAVRANSPEVAAHPDFIAACKVQKSMIESRAKDKVE